MRAFPSTQRETARGGQRVRKRVAVVTAASKGIGASIGIHLAAEGAAVAINYVSEKAGAGRVVEQISRNGGKAIAVQANVATEDDVQRLFAETKRGFEGIDILVNNAGVYELSLLEEITQEHSHRYF